MQFVGIVLGLDPDKIGSAVHWLLIQMSIPKISQINFYRQKINVHTITVRQTDRQTDREQKNKSKK